MNKLAFFLCVLLAATSIPAQTQPSLSPRALQALRNPPAVGDHSFVAEAAEVANAFNDLFATAMADAFPDLNDGNYLPPAGGGSLTQAAGATQQQWEFAAGFESTRRVKISTNALSDIEQWMLQAQGDEGFKQLTVECFIYSGAPESTVDDIHGTSFVKRPAGQYSIPGATGMARFAKEFQWWTSEDVHFYASDRAVYGHAANLQYQYLYWQFGNHVVKVHACASGGEAGVHAIAGRVHTALMSAGFYDFPDATRWRERAPAAVADAAPGPSDAAHPGTASTATSANITSELFLDMVRDGRAAEVGHLVKSGRFSGDVADAEGVTALMWASASSQTLILKMLLETPVSLETHDAEGRTAVWHAVTNGNIDAMKLLLEAGASHGRVDLQGTSALALACKLGHEDLAKALIGAGADVNLRGDGGDTALHWACNAGDLSCVRLLLDAGADVNTTTKEGLTPMFWAQLGEHREIEKLLVARGARTSN